jgi:hypothetical protein
VNTTNNVSSVIDNFTYNNDSEEGLDDVLPFLISCHDRADELVPENVTVYEGDSQCRRKLYGSWTNGEPVVLVGKNVEYWNGENRKFQVVIGSLPGEDTFKYYLKDYGEDKVSFKYTKQVIKDGVIKGYDSFEIVVDSFSRIKGSETELEEFGCMKYEYALGEYEFLSCENII